MDPQFKTFPLPEGCRNPGEMGGYMYPTVGFPYGPGPAGYCAQPPPCQHTVPAEHYRAMRVELIPIPMPHGPDDNVSNWDRQARNSWALQQIRTVLIEAGMARPHPEDSDAKGKAKGKGKGKK